MQELPAYKRFVVPISSHKILLYPASLQLLCLPGHSASSKLDLTEVQLIRFHSFEVRLMQSQGVPKKRGVFNSQAKMSNHFLQSCNSPENSSILQNLRATQSSYSQTNQPFRYCCLYVVNYACFALSCKTRHFLLLLIPKQLSYICCQEFPTTLCHGVKR